MTSLRVRSDSRRWSPASRAARRLADVPLFWKLLAPGVVVTLAVGLVTLFLTVRLEAAGAREELDRRLSRSGLRADAGIQTYELDVLETARLTANLDGMAEALAVGDGEAATEALLGVMATRHLVDLAVLAGPEGVGLAEVVSADGEPRAGRGRSWTGNGFVAQVLSERRAEGYRARAGLVDPGRP